MKSLLAAAMTTLLPLSVAAQQAPDLILLNGHVFTSDHGKPWVQAVAIAGNRIAATGTSDEIASLAGASTKRIDLRGRLVIPGLNDAHVELATPLEIFKMSTNAESSGSDIAVALISAADESPSSTWLIGTVAPKSFHDPAVTAAALEKTAPGRNVILMSPSGRACVLSASALHALRIDWNAPDPAGGWFERDASGHLTGKAFEYAESNAGRALTSQVSDQQAVMALQEFASQALRYGITSVQMLVDFPLSRFEKIVRHADVGLRIRMIRSPQTDANGRDAREGNDLPKRDDERKLAVISGTSWTIDEIDPGGRFDFPETEIGKMFTESLASNDQLILSIRGPRIAGTLFDAMRTAQGIDWKPKRVRFDKPETFSADLIPAAKSLGVVVIEDPAHSSAAFLKSLLGGGVSLAFGGGEMNPYQTIMLALDSMTREEAVEVYSRGGAFAEFSENEKGTIAAGKLADLVVLSQDIFKAKVDEIPDSGSVLTIVDGKIVFDDGVLDVPGRRRPKPPPLELPEF